MVMDATRLFSLLSRHRIGVLTLLAAATLVFGGFAARVGFDNSIESYFLANDLASYNRFLSAFGSDEVIAVGFEADDIFSAESFDIIDSLSRELEQLPHVRRVISLTTARVVTAANGGVSFGRLTPPEDFRGTNYASIRQMALADAVLPGTIVSRDGRSTAVVAEIDHLVGEFDYKTELLAQVRELVAAHAGGSGKHCAIAGTSVLDDALFRYTERDQQVFFPLMIVLIFAAMYAVFRSLVATVLPIVIVVISVLWAYGLMAMLGYKVNVISMITAPLLMAVGVADAVHLMADFMQRPQALAGNARAGAAGSFDALLRPCFLTSVTTVAGLGSLLSADLAPLRQFGLVASFGIAVAFVVTMIALPTILPYVPLNPRSSRNTRTHGAITRLLEHLSTWQRGRAITVVVVCAMLLPPAAASARHIVIGTNSLDFFRHDDPVRLDTAWIDSRVGGTTSLEFIVDSGITDGILEPALLAKMEAFQDYLDSFDGITGAYSIVDLIKSVNRAFEDGRAESFRLPKSRTAVAQEVLVLEGSDDFRALVTSDYQRGRISARVSMEASRELAHQTPQIEAEMRRIFADEATVTPTGIVYLMHRMEGYLLSSQLKSFALAFVVIAISMTLALGSLRLGVLAMIPNFLPIFFVIALMPALGIALDVGTVMIAGVALGLVVDDTIHLLYRFKLESNSTPDAPAAMAVAIRDSGHAVINTSLVLCLGFSVLMLASFSPVVHFGLLAALVIAFALLFDLVVLPAIVGFLRTH